jgi:ADP-heptose:LPS heptosyltransferase
MAWCSGRPSVALFGSTRSDWSRPLGPHSVLLDSSDMPCGNCMAPECRFGDVRCLTRYTPDRVLGTATDLLARLGRAP